MPSFKHVVMVATALTLGAPALAQTGPAAPAPAPSPTLRQASPSDGSLPRQRIVTVFGTDPCPKATDPDEIIVCTRRPDDERDRIPAAVRQPRAKPPGVDSGGNRNILLGDGAGGAGGSIGSCTAIGPGGSIGCTQQQIDAWRAERREPQTEPQP